MASMRKRSAKSATSAMSAPANGQRRIGSALASRNATKTATCQVGSIIRPIETTNPPRGERFWLANRRNGYRARHRASAAVISRCARPISCPAPSASPPSRRTTRARSAARSAAARSYRSRRSGRRLKKNGAPVKIAVDAMGGDHAPDEIVRGALLYRQKGGASELVLVGREDAVRKLVGAEIPPGVTLRDAKEVAEKGGRIQLAAHALLEGAEDLNFYGNIEGRDVMRGITDICVTDGFTGNVLAKGMEGVVDVFVDGIRHDIFGGPLGKVAALFALGGLSKFRSRMDYDPYVSAPLLGVAGISVVTHGRAKANMMRRAIEVAERAVSTRLLDALGEGVASAA